MSDRAPASCPATVERKSPSDQQKSRRISAIPFLACDDEQRLLKPPLFHSQLFSWVSRTGPVHFNISSKSVAVARPNCFSFLTTRMQAAAIDYIPFDPSIPSNGGTEKRWNQVAQPYLLNSSARFFCAYQHRHQFD